MKFIFAISSFYDLTDFFLPPAVLIDFVRFVFKFLNRGKCFLQPDNARLFNRTHHTKNGKGCSLSFVPCFSDTFSLS